MAGVADPLQPLRAVNPASRRCIPPRPDMFGELSLIDVGKIETVSKSLPSPSAAWWNVAADVSDLLLCLFFYKKFACTTTCFKDVHRRPRHDSSTHHDVMQARLEEVLRNRAVLSSPVRHMPCSTNSLPFSQFPGVYFVLCDPDWTCSIDCLPEKRLNVT